MVWCAYMLARHCTYGVYLMQHKTKCKVTSSTLLQFATSSEKFSQVLVTAEMCIGTNVLDVSAA